MGSGTKRRETRVSPEDQGGTRADGRLDEPRPSPAAYLTGEGMRPPQPAHISTPVRPSALNTPHIPRNSAITRADDCWPGAVRSVSRNTVPAHSHGPSVGTPGACYHARRARGSVGRKAGLPVCGRRRGGREVVCVPPTVQWAGLGRGRSLRLG